MHSHHTRPRRVDAFTKVVAVVFVALVAAMAAAPLAGAAALTPGQAASVRALTGQAAAAVGVRDACAPPSVGHASCLAQGLVSASTGQPLAAHPLRASRAEVEMEAGVASGPLALALPGAAPAGATPSSEPAAATAPSAGTPLFLQQAYDLSALSATAGSGKLIAIVDAYTDPSAASDLAYYRQYFALPACTVADGCFRVVGESGSSTLPTDSNSGWQSEETLDMDAVSALCPNCHILLVEANSSSPTDLEEAEQSAVADGATIVSDSWASLGPTGSVSQTAFSYPGVAVLAASGDSGWNSNTSLTPWPAAFPSVTAVGGTSLSASTTARGFTETAWSDGGSGCATESKPAYQSDNGCSGRSYSDLSADADPNTGLVVYDSATGGWAVWGGTSLATPLTAAYLALVGGTAGQGNAAWAYGQGSLLNDPSSGNNSGGAACTPSYICNAGSGYDGPTGSGSISGDVVAGAPGIGGPDSSDGYVQSQAATTASLSAGIYPNGEATTYYVEYGPTTSYGQTSAITSVGSGAAIVATTTTLTGLAPGVGYHYRLIATNASGTTYGYDETFAGGGPAVTITSQPAPSSTATSGVVDYSESPTVTATACTLDGVATACSASSATLTGLSLGQHTFAVTVSAPGGTGSASANFTVVAAPAPAVLITSTPLAGSSATSATVSYSESGAVSQTACELDGRPVSCTSSSAALTGLSVGGHTFVVSVTGPGGADSATAKFSLAARSPSSKSSSGVKPAPSAVTAPAGARTAVWYGLRLSPAVVSTCGQRAHACESSRARFHFHLRRSARVTFTLSRKLDGRTRLIGKLTVSLAAGERRYTLARRFDGHTLAAGTYALSAYAVASTTTSAGHRATQVSSVFRAALRVD